MEGGRKKQHGWNQTIALCPNGFLNSYHWLDTLHRCGGCFLLVYWFWLYTPFWILFLNFSSPFVLMNYILFYWIWISKQPHPYSCMIFISMSLKIGRQSLQRFSSEGTWTILCMEVLVALLQVGNTKVGKLIDIEIPS